MTTKDASKPLRASAFLLGPSVAALLAATPAVAQDTGAANVQVQEVVVTAGKRPEKLQDVPATLSVLSGSSLQAQGVEQLSDYVTQAPGLNLIGGAAPGQGALVMRGISSGDPASSAHPLVGQYLDDVPLSISSPNAMTGVGLIFDPDLADIERIEVLEGPQSTLYGASAMGGVVKFITKQPDFGKAEASLQVTGSSVDGGGIGWGIRASANQPLSDNVAVRASVFYREDPGYVTNLYTDQHNINRDQVEGGRASIRFALTSSLETTVSGFYQHTRADGLDEVYLDPATLRPALGSLAYSAVLNQPQTITNWSVNDTTILKLKFASLTNIASYAETQVSDTIDYSLYGAFIGMPAGDLVPGTFANLSHRASDELRLVSSPGKFEWLTGVFVTDEQNPDRFNFRGANPSGVILPSSSPFYNIYTYANSNSYKEAAVFGDATYHFTDQFQATVGVRYSYDKQLMNGGSTGVLAGPSGLTFLNDESDSAVTYLGTVSYKPTSTMTLYLRAASAYRPGGPNILSGLQIADGAPATFGPDSLWNYEGGIKGSLWDQKITYSIDGYHMIWSNMQLNVFVGGGTVVANASSSESDGGEVSVGITPVDNLSVVLNASYTDARLTGPIGAPIFAVAGDPLPFSPKFTFATIVDYRFAPVNGATPRVGFTYSYRDSEETAFAATAGLSGQGVHTLPSYNTLDLRAGIDWARYSLTARIENVTNQYALSDAYTNNAPGAPLVGVVIRPRTFSLALAVHF